MSIALGTMFTLGILATRAEPALNVLGQVRVKYAFLGGFHGCICSFSSAQTGA